MAIQFKRDMKSIWPTNNTILLAGQPGFETDTRRLKVGDGSTAWPQLKYIDSDTVDNCHVDDTKSDANSLWTAQGIATALNGMSLDDGTPSTTQTYSRNTSLTIPYSGYADQSGYATSSGNTDQLMDIIDGNFQVSSIGAAKNTAYHPVGASYPIWDTWRWNSVDATCNAVWQDLFKVTTIGNVPGSRYCSVMSWSSALSTTQYAYRLTTFIEKGVTDLCQYPALTISFYARADTTGRKINVGLDQWYGTGGSPSTDDVQYQTITLNVAWQKYSVTFTPVSPIGKTFGTSVDDCLCVIFSNDGVINNATSGYLVLTQVQLDVGSIALPYRNKTLDQELQRTMRYYEKSTNYGEAPYTPVSTDMYSSPLPTTTIANYQRLAHVPFKVQKRVAPTVIICPYTTPTNTGRVSQMSSGLDLSANSGVALAISTNSFAVENQSGSSLTLTNNGVIFAWMADARY